MAGLLVPDTGTVLPYGFSFSYNEVQFPEVALRPLYPGVTTLPVSPQDNGFGKLSDL